MTSNSSLDVCLINCPKARPVCCQLDIFLHRDKHEQHSINFPEPGAGNRFPALSDWDNIFCSNLLDDLEEQLYNLGIKMFARLLL